MIPVTLGDDVVTLSPPTFDDLEAITAICQDPQIQRWTTVPSPYEEEHARGFVTHVTDAWALLRANPPQGTTHEAVWAVRTAGQLVGMVGLHPDGQGSAEIGYWLAPEARGRGLMVRAVRLALDVAFDPEALDLQRVTWNAFVGNLPSWAVAWRCGFRLEGQVRGHTVQRGRRLDCWVATLLREDPRAPREPWPGTVAPVTLLG